jgi:hypothetical protein
MSQQTLRDIQEQKRLLVAQGDLQRSTFLLIAQPIFKLIRVVDVGFITFTIGKSITQRFKSKSCKK